MKKLIFLSFLVLITGMSACKHKKQSQIQKIKPALQKKAEKKAASTKTHPKTALHENQYPKKPAILYRLAKMNLSEKDRKIIEMLGTETQGRKALGAIMAMGDDGNRILKKALRWTNPNGRLQAAIIASRLKDPGREVLALMTQNLLQDPDPDCRAQTAAAFVNLRYQPAGPYLLKMLVNDPYPMARANAAWALGAMRYQNALWPLITALNNKATWVRLRAASALKKLANKKAIRAIRIHIKTEKDLMVKKRLKQALRACERHQ